MVVANAMLRAARRARGEALEGLASGVLAPAELLELASGEDGKALRRIPIRTMLRELGCTGRRCDERMALFRRLAKVDAGRSDRELTIGWLIDRRTNGLRVAALAEVIVPGYLSGSLRPPPTSDWPYGTPARR